MQISEQHRSHLMATLAAADPQQSQVELIQFSIFVGEPPEPSKQSFSEIHHGHSCCSLLDHRDGKPGQDRVRLEKIPGYFTAFWKQSVSISEC